MCAELTSHGAPAERAPRIFFLPRGGEEGGGARAAASRKFYKFITFYYNSVTTFCKGVDNFLV